ncbi:MAG: hypothetical protein FWG93_03975 [Oscillospiraceae bacterium]|nr:hypothetical protein [Oscillospiraceae bacterium]
MKLERNSLCLWLALLFGALSAVCVLWYAAAWAVELFGKLRGAKDKAERKAKNILDAVLH